MSQDLSNYVYLEAKERAFEMEIEARKEFEMRKEKIKNESRAKIEQEFQVKKDQKVTKYNIEKANLINRGRAVKLAARNQAILKLMNKSQLEMKNKIRSDEAFYREFLTNTILEGLIIMMEPVIKIRCLKRDEALVKEVAKVCVERYKSIVKEQLAQDVELELTIDEDNYMIERTVQDFSGIALGDFTTNHELEIKIPKHEDDKRCFGGVVLTNISGDTLLKNTMDIRIEITFADCLPAIRGILFK